MGIGWVFGLDWVIEVVKKVIFSLLLDVLIDGVRGVLLNIISGSSLSFYEV